MRAMRFLTVATLACLLSLHVESQSLPLIQPPNLVYQGASRLPAGEIGTSNFAYANGAMAFNPAHNSLYVVGHEWHQQVAEISIPAPVNSADVNALPRATVLQTFADPTEGKIGTVDEGTIKIGGLMVAGGQLYGTAYSYYDNAPFQILTHFSRPLNLSDAGKVKGMYQVGSLPGSVSGWMVPIPSAWASLGGPVLTGQCCIPIIGRTSNGPSAFAMNPADLGVQIPAPATKLLHYPAEHPLNNSWDQQSELFNGTTAIKGVVFPEGSGSMLFVGRQGIGPFCYGESSTCGDPEVGGKGNHAYPYVYQVWAYAAADLLAVKNGQKQSWEVRPYATWRLTFPFRAAETLIGGVAYDSATQRILVSQSYGDGAAPLLHHFTLNGLPSVPVPPPTPPPTPPVADVESPAITMAMGRRTGNTYPVTMTITDNVGVEHTEVWVDGSLQVRMVAPSSGASTWASRVVIKGSGVHSVEARAFDDAKNRGVASVTVKR